MLPESSFTHKDYSLHQSISQEDDHCCRFQNQCLIKRLVHKHSTAHRLTEDVWSWCFKGRDVFKSFVFYGMFAHVKRLELRLAKSSLVWKHRIIQHRNSQKTTIPDASRIKISSELSNSPALLLIKDVWRWWFHNIKIHKINKFAESGYKKKACM